MKVFSIEEYLFISLLCQLSQKKYSYLSPDNSLYLHNVINILHPHFVVGLRKLCILYSILKFIYFSKKKNSITEQLFGVTYGFTSKHY